MLKDNLIAFLRQKYRKFLRKYAINISKSIEKMMNI